MPSHHPTPRQRAVRSLIARGFFVLGIWLLTAGFLADTASAGKTLHPSGSRGLAKSPSEGVININEATANELSFLPRIGLKKAERIVLYRVRKPFRLIGHLARVKGIGRKTVRSLRPWLRLRGPTTVKAPISVKSRKR